MPSVDAGVGGTVEEGPPACGALPEEGELRASDGEQARRRRCLDDIGSRTWGARTGGRLGRRERRIVLGGALLELARAIPGYGALALGRRGAGSAPISVVDVPDTALARHVQAVAVREQSPAMVGHALRTVAFAHALSALDGIEVDPELLWCACLLHDVAIEHPVPGRCFAVRGGEIARAAARDAGASTAVGETLADAVCRHATPRLDPRREPLAHAVAGGALVDVLAKRLADLDPGFVAAVLRAHPRGDFGQVVADAWRAEARAVPDGRARVVDRLCFSALARRAPLRDPAVAQATV